MNTIFTISLIAVSCLSFGQTAEQREVIKASMYQNTLKSVIKEVKLVSLEKENRIEAFLKNNPDKEKSFVKDGKIYSLYNVTKEGEPIYITTKDLAQVNNSKASTLYSGGSIGVNITGTSMVVGIWDGGQVNSNHELLLGQVSMQAGQTLSSVKGNDHQQAVTGIIVGKNTYNARGIAYGATSKNYDWDSDLVEMDAFANSGYLISNHSYGYANDNTTPVWTFGAYDSQSKAWDALLKAKPFYLPFVAGGNEQQSNGNTSASGFDIITGSSSSKNVVTVGAINSDNSMSDYSNWGPTDDGRIKPDIVTLGSSVNVPLYDGNSGYTGSVTESSGTSYASPAAAAGALLLQQYYYALNNAYMKASMLKALLLHSADDDVSNNGPDSKFGWGILNLEKAANIIKQNSASNGTAKMIMISTNPANNATAEIVNNFTFGSNGVRSSLCWVDDDGAEQVVGDGVNNSTSRMVYNFSMKLEQNSPALVAFPYNNLSITSPSVAAVAGNNWFQTANNYLQANLSNTTNNVAGKISIRKSSSSPADVREMALIVTGLGASSLSLSPLDKNENILFFDKLNNKIKLISNNGKIINDYKIYSLDGKLINSGNASSTEIDFNIQTKGFFIIKYEIENQFSTLKFTNY